MILSKNKIKSINIDLEINNYIANSRLDELLIIVPTNRRIRYLKRELITFSPDQSVSKLNLFTLGTFATEMFQQEKFSSAKVLTDASAAVLLNKSFKETNLKYFSNYKNEIPRGTLDRVKNVISEYKKNGISPEKILNTSKKLSGSEEQKAWDIASIYKKYLDNCLKVKAYEIGDIYLSVLNLKQDEFDNRFKKIFNNVKKVIINGFDEFTLPEINLINCISDIKNMELYVVFDYYKFNPALFSHLDVCYESLKIKGFEEIEDTSSAILKNYTERVREKIFLLDEKDNPQKSEIKIIQISASSPDEEIKLIAKEIKRLIISEKILPDSICVTFNLISEHSLMIRDIFEEYGIPFNLTDRFSLSESQPIIALVNFLEILQNNFYYKNIFRALTGKWIRINGVELSNLLRVASNLKIVSGYHNWNDSIDRIIEEIHLSDDEGDGDLLPVEFYVKAKVDILKINELLKPFNTKLTVDEFKKNIHELTFTLKLPEKILNDDSDLIEKNVKALTVFLETIDEIFDLLKQENGETKKYSLDFFLDQIKTALQFTRYNVKERHGSGVLVTSVNEIRGLNFDFVFIGGMVDGEFPTRYQPEIFFSGSFKKDEYKHIREERYHFYQALCSANKSLYLTNALKDEKKEFTPSSFLSDFKRIFKVEEKKAENYNHLIQSKSELLKVFDNLSTEAKKDEKIRSVLDAEKFHNDLSIDILRQTDVFSESPYNGFIFNSLSDEAKTKLLEQKDKQYSAYQLEEYAKCPFQYFAKRILHLESVEEPSEELESLELGSVVHSILFEFYKTIKEKKIILADCSEEEFRKAEKIIFRIAEDKIEKLRLTTSLMFFEREKILGVAGNRKNSILFKFLEEERRSKNGFVPEYFEKTFGKFYKTSGDDSPDVYVSDVKVRGKIDRIDIDKSKNYFKVIDYKLGGNKPRKSDIETGISLQLPLYVYASKKLIESELNNECLPAAAVIYSLKLNKSEFGEKNIYLSNAKNLSEVELIKLNEELIKICDEFIPEYVNRISEGKFHLSQLEDRENKVCRFCDFKSICRIQEAK